MQLYKNLSGKSGINAFEIGNDFIEVEFKNASKNGFKNYKYSYKSATSNHVEQMKKLAILGQGLGKYIHENVQYQYESKK